MAEVRIRTPKSVKKGDTITVRALVPHPMEVIERKDGKVVEKVYNFIHTATVNYNGKDIMTAQMTQSVSANPFIAFPLKVDAPGKLTITFLDTTGAKHTGSVDIKF